MDLSLTESMLFLMEGLWVEESSRHKVHIADTILIRNDLPVKWLFTCNDGFVLRKGKQQLRAIENIPSSLRRTLQKKYKSPIGARSKIAKVWTLQQDILIEELLDQAQLSAKLKSPSQLEHVFMIQIYLEGKPYRGCGLFKHQYVVCPTEDVPQLSWELTAPPPPRGEVGSELIQQHSSKLSVPKEIDTALRDISKQVVGWLEAYSGFTVELALLTFTLTASGVFVLTGIESVRLSNVPRKMKERNKVVTRTNPIPMVNATQKTTSNNMKARPRSAVPTSRARQSPTKGYALLTESRRLKSDSLAILEGLRPSSSSRRRPSSAPLRRSSTLPTLNGHHGNHSNRIDETLQVDYALGYLKRTTCEGDLCGTLMHLKEPAGEDEGLFATQVRRFYSDTAQSR